MSRKNIPDVNMDYKKIYSLSWYENLRNENAVKDLMEEPKYYSICDTALKLPMYVTSAGHYIVGDKYYTIREGMDSWQIIYTCDGKGYVETEDKKHICERGTALIINCNKKHTYHCSKGSTWNYKHMHITGNPGSEVMLAYAENELVFGGKLLEEIMDKTCANLIVNDVNQCFYQYADLTKFLVKMITLKNNEKMNSNDHSLVEEIAEYLEENFDKKIVIANLADKNFVSVFHLTRLFTARFNVSPYEYLLQHRINQSKIMLLNGATVQQVSKLCGFTNTSNYLRAFEKYAGSSPEEFKNSIISK